jgi:hypothetical protein
MIAAMTIRPQRPARGADQGFCGHAHETRTRNRGLRAASALSGPVPMVTNDQVTEDEQSPEVPRQLGRVRSLGYTIGYIETDPYCQPGKSTAPEHPTWLTRPPWTGERPQESG